jgi:hypothetical protein
MWQIKTTSMSEPVQAGLHLADRREGLVEGAPEFTDLDASGFETEAF